MRGNYLILNMEKKTPLADAIRNEVMNNRVNFNILITGPVQYRKSTTMVSLAFSIDPTFDWEKDFAIIKTKNMIKTVSSEGPRGTVKALDEVGIGMDHHQWYTFFSRAMTYIVETSGFEGKIAIVTSPYSDIVNKDVLKFFNMHIKILGKNEKKKYVIAKITTLEYNDDTKKIYKRYPRGKYTDGTVRMLKFFKIKFADEEKMKEYFELSNPEKKNLQYDLIAETEKMEADKVRKMFSPEHYVAEIMKEPKRFSSSIWGREYISKEKIMNEFPGIGDGRSRRIKKMAEEKLGMLPGSEGFAKIQEGEEPADRAE